jgi:hypothetical protein
MTLRSGDQLTQGLDGRGQQVAATHALNLGQVPAPAQGRGRHLCTGRMPRERRGEYQGLCFLDAS